jgi:succinyl-CoA synthetase beta subunit
MYQHHNLLAISSGGDVKKYALKVFGLLFTTDELANGIVDPARESSGKIQLDVERTNLLKGIYAPLLNGQFTL